MQQKERKTSGSLEDLANYKREKNGYNWMQKITRSDYYKGEIENCGNDYKAIYKIVNRLSGRKEDMILQT